MKKLLLIAFVLTYIFIAHAAHSQDAPHVIYASAFLVDPDAPAIHASAFLYDPDAAPLYASAFVPQ